MSHNKRHANSFKNRRPSARQLRRAARFLAQTLARSSGAEAAAQASALLFRAQSVNGEDYRA